MARLIFGGGEWGDAQPNTTADVPNADGFIPCDGNGPGSSYSVVATPVRSGAFSYRIQATSLGDRKGPGFKFTAVSGRTYYARQYIRFDLTGDLPASAGDANAFPLLKFGDVALGVFSNTYVAVYMHTDNTLSMRNMVAGGLTPTQSGASTAAITFATWYRLEIALMIDTASGNDYAEARLDGVTIGSVYNGDISDTLHGAVVFGYGGRSVTGKPMYVDDLALNDSTGTDNNSWCGAGRVILLPPVSDNARGVWTAGGGGTTNLFAGVDNRPPIGVATPTNADSIVDQSATLPAPCDLNIQDYTTAGLTGSEFVACVRAMCNDGEWNNTTNAKSTELSLVSNPAISALTFNLGDDTVTLIGTYPIGWRWHHTAIVDKPTVTAGTQPVIRIRPTTNITTTRRGACDAIGLMAEFQTIPATTKSMIADTKRRVRNVLLRR